MQAAQLEPEIFTPVRTRAPINFTPFYPLGKNVARHPSFKIGCPELRLVIKNPPANAGDSRDANSIPGLGRFPGEGKGNPLQYSCLGKPMDRAGGPQTMGSLRVRRDWARTQADMHAWAVLTKSVSGDTWKRSWSARCWPVLSHLSESHRASRWIPLLALVGFLEQDRLITHPYGCSSKQWVKQQGAQGTECLSARARTQAVINFKVWTPRCYYNGAEIGKPFR